MEFELRSKTWLNKNEVAARVKGAVIKRVLRCGLLVEAEAKRRLSKGAKAIMTRDEFGNSKRSGEFTKAAAGDPPQMRTGNLRSSIQAAQSGPESCVVGPTSTAWYGRVHEFGATITVTRKMAGYLLYNFGWMVHPGSTIVIPKRPFMRPALLAMAAKFPEQFKDLPIGGEV